MLHLRPATDDDVDAVVALVESAYRGETSRAGWTTEADLLEGNRTDAPMVAAIVARADAAVLLAHDDDGALVACCQVEDRGDVVYLGMLTVRPGRQGNGLGRALLEAAENWAWRTWGSRAVELTAIAQRSELIAWYERRGYRVTDRREPFPYGDERFGRPLRDDLEFVVMRKDGRVEPTTQHTDDRLDLPRTAVVTGAGRGIGRGLATGLARAGWAVALVGRTEETLAAVAREIEADGGTALVVPADVADPARVRDAAAQIEEGLAPHGGLALLVNNAGVIERQEVPFLDDDPDDVWRVVEVNVRGPLLLTHALLPGMLARGGGRIVNLNSGAAHRPSTHHTGYGISKGALARITTMLDAQYRDQGLRVFDLAPGVVETDMTRSMPVWDGKTDWTPVEDVVELLLGLASGELDALSGRFVRAGTDTVESLSAITDQVLAHDARRLGLIPYAPDDPVA